MKVGLSLGQGRNPKPTLHRMEGYQVDSAECQALLDNQQFLSATLGRF